MRLLQTAAIAFSSLALSASAADEAALLGINCRGSGLCPRASWNNGSNIGIIQLLRNALWESRKHESTVYNSGDHLICVSQSQPITIGGSISGGRGGAKAGVKFSLKGNIGEGGICVFPQGGSVTLGQARRLADALLKHGCGTCGSVPLHFVDQGSNDPKGGILTFNYVQSPYCVENCISDTARG